MSELQIGAVIAGAVIVVLSLWWIVRSHAAGSAFHQNVEISFDKVIPDDRDAASSDAEISFDKDIPDGRP